jgi:protein MAK11
MDKLEDYEILLGTYEAFILGYKLSEGKKPTLVTSFADHAHAGSIRSIAAGDKFLISAGADEIVKVFNLRNRTEHGTLSHADSVINAMTFYDKRHLITCAEDGKVCILKTGTWNVEKTMLKHSLGVIDIAIHPSGKMALTIGKDRKLITWNLIKGRSAFVTNIKEMADFVRWSPDGQRYVVGFYKRVDVYSVADAAIEFTVKLNGRSNDVVFLDDNTFALAGEMPQVEIYSLITKTLLYKFDAHETRVRCLAFIGDTCLVTASNDCKVKVWKLTKTGTDYEALEEGSVDTKCRITSMVVHKVPKVKQNNDEVKPEVVAALVKEVTQKKRSIGFAEPTKEADEVTEDAAGKKQKVVVVEHEVDETSPKKKKKNNRWKKKKPVST